MSRLDSWLRVFTSPSCSQSLLRAHNKLYPANLALLHLLQARSDALEPIREVLDPVRLRPRPKGSAHRVS